MRRRFLAVAAALTLCVTAVGQAIAAPVQIQAAPAATSNMPSSPTDESKVPHYYGPYPNWANSPQALADAVVRFTPASAAPVSIGNGLVARANATDDPAPTGIAPVFVVLPAQLPAGTLTAFQVLNQALAGGAATPSAGGTFNAYVLRPTANPNEFTVVYDSGPLTMPALSTPGADQTDSFAVTGGLPVLAGDQIAFFGAGIPFDAAGADAVSSPVTAAPVKDATIVMGDAATFPLSAVGTRTYSLAATVTPRAVDPGVGAEATATVDPKDGSVSAITVTKPGSGYLVPPTVTIDSPGITPTSVATATAAISPGAISSVSVDDPGFGYTQPQVVVSGGGTPTTVAVLTASGGIDNLTLTAGGSGYTAPSVVISQPDLQGGVQATAGVQLTNGAITDITIANAGSGYTKAPTVSIYDQNAPANDPALATATIKILTIDVTNAGAGYTSAPTLDITDATGSGVNAAATALVSEFGAVTGVTVITKGAGYITPGIKKFVDTLPGVGSGQANDLGQYIPVATPDTTTYPGTDYYEIGLVQYRMKFHQDLPATLLRGYVQLSTSVVPGKQVQLKNENLDPSLPAAPITLPNGSPALGVDDPHYLGPAIVATKDRPVRILFRNLLPTGSGGDLFLPVDTTFMGAGDGPDAMMLNPDKTPMDMTVDQGSVMDAVRNPRCATTPKPADCYTENRATIHLHGGITPWISDGTPHQWITPAGEATDYPQGVSVQNVPDMPDPGPGAQTFFYTNQQSARLLFYHDHAWGITRLNVYAGEAAAYLITDDTEKALVANHLIPDAAHTKELVIQDRTFVPSATQMALEDPTWDYAKYGGMGNLWYEHVYMPAENPADPSGMSSFGRWFYGPYFWPPATSKYGAIANPYYDANCKLDDPATWQYKTDPFCEPPTIPGTPNSSSGMEQFNDTPIVNGTAYPKTSVDPTTYRFKILNAANDRFWNLQWYVADPRTGTLSEVALDPAKLAAAQTDPNAFPTPDTTWSPAGPSWVQIATEGGFLSSPAVIPNQPITWITDQTRFDFGNVDQHSLLLAPAERADVVVDFSQFRGKTLILYNDAPAAFPGRISCYDYYTGGPDLSPSCAPSTLPGYGPNTRTIMRVDVGMGTPTAMFDRPNTTNDGLGRLTAAFAHHADGSGVFESGQNPIIVGQAAYNGAYGSNFVSGSWCNDPKASPTAKCDGYARINEQGGDDFKFDTLSGNQVSIPIQPKAIHDEMNAANFDDYGRMTSNMGVEAPGATPLTQNIILYPFVNPATEVFDESNSPDPLHVTPISTNADGTQIWKITHNGVDTHPIHFHLYDIQLINRVTWDNIILPPDANELGWKDTVRVSPLEDTIVAVRPVVPKVPWGVLDSHRVLNPMMPVGAQGSQAGPNGHEAGFNNTDVNGNPINPIVNTVQDFGWEYVWHCHILSHEEMDMMRPVIVNVPFALADAPVLSRGVATGSVLNWTDGTPVDYANPATWGSPKGEVGYRIERAPVTNGVTGDFVKVGSAVANATAYTDTPPDLYQDYAYRVVAWNEAGDSVSNVLVIQGLPLAPTALQASIVAAPTLPAGSQVALSWTNNATNASSIVVERAIGAGAFSVLATLPPTDSTYTDQAVLPGPYSYRVYAANQTGNSGYAGPTTITVPQPGSATVALSAPNPSLVGDNVTFTATVSAIGASSAPTGNVTFSVDGTPVSTGTLASGVAAFSTTALTAGSHTITADYAGDAIFLPSSGSTTQVVNKLDTTTVVTSSNNPSIDGQSVTFTATVNPAAATGSVQFSIDGSAAGVPIALAGGQATYTTSLLSVGAHTVSAAYLGDTTYNGSASATLTQTVGSKLIATSTVVTSNRNPAATYGQSVTFTAAVTPATGTTVPTGTVQFSIDGVNAGVPVTLSATGRATYTAIGLGAGSHTILATYGGSLVFAGSSSSPFTQLVNQAATTTRLASNRNPAVFGQAVTFTATVSPAAAGGQVQFSIDGSPYGVPVTLSATGRATLVVSTLTIGTHPVTVSYLGSANYAASSSATLTETINKGASRTVVRSSLNPARLGTTVVFTATVSAVSPATGIPTGTVQFRIDGVNVGAPVVLNSSGQAAYATSSLATGWHTVTAVYSGSGNFNGSTSGTLNQRIR